MGVRALQPRVALANLRTAALPPKVTACRGHVRRTSGGLLPTIVDGLTTVVYMSSVIEIVETEVFQGWLAGLKYAMARARILARLKRASLGNVGDWKAVGGGVVEMRIDHGPGYRVYFARRGDRLIIILAGGTKRTQEADIAKAIEIARQLE